MQTTKKKPSLIFILVGAVLAGYLGYLINGAWSEGVAFNEFMNRFNEVCAAPFANYYNTNTIKAVAIALGIYAMAIVMYYTSQRNYMPGKEFGTARFENPKQVNKILADKDENFNRILSQNVKMSLDFRRLKLNGNILICGGSGAGKTFYEVKPNLMQMPHNCSFICTDPKGEILRSCGQMLKNNGYNVKVINLLEMDKSDCYNPFSYIREETDVVKLITNLISNTTPKGSTPSDPFWEKAEGLFLQSIFYYVWLEVQPAKRNFETVLKLLGEAEVTEQGKASKLDVRMKFLEESSPLGANHPAVKQYNKCMRGAGDTVRSIIISANSRLAFLENKQVLRLLSKDELNLSDIGIGVNGDGETKTALFCVIPDSDKSYNFIIGMLYTQIFQELYYQADFNCGGRLPIHVTFMLDEFANVALPDDFCSLLSTMRSREISSIIIIQNFAQLKALFKDTWETIPGNCDTFIYLGGNEQSTHKYVSELLGKGTIDKKSSGETKGRQGSSSRNYDVLGRELFTPDEVRKLDNKKCIIFIRGFDPIMDNKFIPFNHPMFNQTADGKGEPYVHEIRGANNLIGPPFEILSDKAVKYYERDALFKEMRTGKKKVLIGSTDKCGTGVNVQTHLVAMHHVDCPWKPSSIEQREGRGIRQGNENEEVAIYRYVTKGTFDAYNWSLVENKQRFISQVMTSKAVSRSCEDIDEATLSYAEIKAVATGNPLIKEKMEIDNDVQRLKLLKASYDNQRYGLQDNFMIKYPKLIKTATEKLANVREDVKARDKELIDNPEFAITIGKVTYTERVDGGTMMLEAISKCKTGETTVIGKFHGFELLVEKNFLGINYMVLRGKTEYKAELSTSPVGSMVKLENLFNGLHENIDFFEKKIEQYQNDLEASKAEYDKPFAYSKELEEKLARQCKLNAQLDLENAKAVDADLSGPEEEREADDRMESAAIVAEDKGAYPADREGRTR